MKIQNTPSYQRNYNVQFQGFGSWLKKVDNKLGKFLQPTPMLTENNQKMIDTVEILAKKRYQRSFSKSVVLNAKNGNKEFLFIYKNSPWHHIQLNKKGKSVFDFEVLHAKNSKDYDFYTTGSYASRLVDKKYQKKYNEILTEWLPRLIKQTEKRDKNFLNPSNK